MFLAIHANIDIRIAWISKSCVNRLETGRLALDLKAIISNLLPARGEEIHITSHDVGLVLRTPLAPQLREHPGDPGIALLGDSVAMVVRQVCCRKKHRGF